MTKYIELIDKYEIRQSDSDEYNPPSYIWIDNTGELIRCKDCRFRRQSVLCKKVYISCYRHCEEPLENDEGFCSWAERREE